MKTPYTHWAFQCSRKVAIEIMEKWGFDPTMRVCDEHNNTQFQIEEDVEAPWKQAEYVSDETWIFFSYSHIPYLHAGIWKIAKWKLEEDGIR